MGSLHRRRDLLAEGHTDEGVRAAIRAGRLTRVRPGVYVEPDDPSRPDTDARHRRLVEATLPLLAPGAVLSHATAVVMHGLPSWGIALRRMHVTRDLSAGGRAGRHVHLHAAPLPAGDVVTVGTTPVTAVARTVVDVARSCSFESAVTVADAALFRGVRHGRRARGRGRGRGRAPRCRPGAGGPGRRRRSRRRPGGVAQQGPDAPGGAAGTRAPARRPRRPGPPCRAGRPPVGARGRRRRVRRHGEVRPFAAAGGTPRRRGRTGGAARGRPPRPAGVRHVVRWTRHDLAPVTP